MSSVEAEVGRHWTLDIGHRDVRLMLNSPRVFQHARLLQSFSLVAAKNIELDAWARHGLSASPFQTTIPGKHLILTRICSDFELGVQVFVAGSGRCLEDVKTETVLTGTFSSSISSRHLIIISLRVALNTAIHSSEA